MTILNFGTTDEYSLTRREREVLRLVALGNSNKEIALALGISRCTVKIHVSNLFLKLGVSCRSDAVTAAGQQGDVRQPLRMVYV